MITTLTLDQSPNKRISCAGMSVICTMVLVASVMLTSCAPKIDSDTVLALSADEIAIIDAVFSDWVSEEAPGGVVAVVSNGKSYTHAYGMANLETGTPLTPESRLHVASISKQFTAYAAALLINEGKLDLSSKAQDYVEEVQQIEEPLLVEQLIHHTSGLRDQWSLASMAGIRPSEVISQRDILTLASQQDELNFQPGEEFIYSNMGYSILAEVVGIVGGAPFPQFVQENIFAPLGMTRTTFFSIMDAPLEGRAMSYGSDGDQYRQLPLNFDNYGATSLQTTANDMVLWLENLLAETPIGGPAMKNLILEKGILNDGREIQYAFALEISEFHGFQAVEHGGSDAGFRAHVMFIPEKQFGIAVLSNRSDGDTSIRARKIAKALLVGENDATLSRPALRNTPPKETRLAFEGEFHVGDGPVMTIAASDEGIIMSAPFWPGVELTQAEVGHFITLDDDVPGVLRFDASIGEGTDEYVFNRGAHEFRGKRITVPNVLPTNADEYVGKYTSSGLDTSYFVDLTEDGLTVRHWRAGPGVLRPIGEDDFASAGGVFGRVRFIRNNAGEITGFEGSDRRAKRVPFVRVSNQSSSDARLPQ